MFIQLHIVARTLGFKIIFFHTKLITNLVHSQITVNELEIEIVVTLSLWRKSLLFINTIYLNSSIHFTLKY